MKKFQISIYVSWLYATRNNIAIPDGERTVRVFKAIVESKRCPSLRQIAKMFPDQAKYLNQTVLTGPISPFN